MNRYNSTSEFVWVKFLQTQLSDEERQILHPRSKSTPAEIAAARAAIDSRSRIPATEQETERLNTFYNNIKPTLKEDQVYSLISVDITESTNGAYRGILNCRINGEHRQVRF
jgi:hypothetical protein